MFLVLMVIREILKLLTILLCVSWDFSEGCVYCICTKSAKFGSD